MQRRTPIVLGVLVALAAGGAWIALCTLDSGLEGRVARITPLAPGAGASGLGSPAVAPRAGDEAGTRTALTSPIAARAERAELAASPDEATHVFRGRVLDEARFAASGAQLELSVRGMAPVLGSATEDGSFELAAALPPGTASAHVLAHDGRSAAARAEVALGAHQHGEPIEVGPLVLVPAHELFVRVTDGGRPAGETLVLVELGHWRSPDFAQETDAQGELHLAHLPPWPVYLTATAGHLEGRALVYVPEESSALIELAPLGEVEVQVVDAATRAGIAGAELVVRERRTRPAALPGHGARFFRGESSAYVPHARFRADEEGRARIDGLSSTARYALTVEAPGYPVPGPFTRTTRLEVGPPMVVELTALETRTVRWPIVPGEVGVPPHGSRIELRHAPGMFGFGETPPEPPHARMEGSTLVAEGITGRPGFIGEAEDGALARLFAPADAELGPETSFRPPRRIEVLVRDASAEPVAGARVVALNQGNNELCPPVMTDAEGRALLEGLHGELANVHVSRSGRDRGRNVGSVNLAQGDGRIEVNLRGWVSARLRVLIDGQPRLPSNYLVRGGGEVSCRVTDEDPEHGELGLELEGEPGATARCFLDATGYRTAVLDFELPADGSLPLIDVVLEKSALLVVRVRGELPEGAQIRPERFDETTELWQTSPLHQGLRNPNGPGGTFVFQLSLPGRWRAVDAGSGTSSSEVELLPGEERAFVELELGAVQWVSGRVELEDPSELQRVRVLVEGLGAAPPPSYWMPGSRPPEGATAHNGTFRLRVPGDRLVRIVPWHPWLVPGRDGTVELREGRNGVVLRLVAGDELHVSAPLLTESRRVQSLRIARFDGEDPELDGEPLAWHHAPLADGLFRCALPRGRWTLWIDPGAECMPLVLRDVAIEGSTHITDAAFERGSALRVQVKVPADQSPPRLYIGATPAGGQRYQRFTNSSGEAEVVLPGLGPGRFHVSLSSILGTGAPQRREVELDGHSDHVIELGLR